MNMAVRADVRKVALCPIGLEQAKAIPGKRCPFMEALANTKSVKDGLMGNDVKVGSGGRHLEGRKRG